MKLTRNPYRHVARDAEDFSYPPCGGRGKQIFWGIIVPLGIAWFAGQAWIEREATWFGDRANITLQGDAAQAMAVCYLAIAAFFHFRYFWGMIPNYRVFTYGTVAAMILGLGSCGTALYFAFR